VGCFTPDLLKIVVALPWVTQLLIAKHFKSISTRTLLVIVNLIIYSQNFSQRLAECWCERELDVEGAVAGASEDLTGAILFQEFPD
jgi:hypothetical protein